jgi:lipopolysaccharide assembly outer membrane protein LptD (OstA)
MRSFSISIFIELVVVIIVLYFILTSTYYSSFYIRGYNKEDLYASLISINYMDLNNTQQLNNSLYQIVTNILPYYYVEINGQVEFNNTNLNESEQGIETFYIINGSIDYVDIYWK